MCVNQGFIVIELELSYEPSAHLRWHTLSPVKNALVGPVVLRFEVALRYFSRATGARESPHLGSPHVDLLLGRDDGCAGSSTDIRTIPGPWTRLVDGKCDGQSWTTEVSYDHSRD